MKRDAVLVIMAKEPQIGRTKTRLCPPLTPKQAASFYGALLADTIDLAANLKDVDLAVAITPPESHPYFAGITPEGTLLLPVTGATIGECLAAVLGRLLDMGFRKAIALNSDGPSLPEDYLVQAVHLLDTSDLVIGPAEDGGYYLLGLKCFTPALFTEIDWSTGRVLEQTLARSQMMGLETRLTPPWYDIDTAQDILRLAADLDRLPANRLVATRRFFSDFPLVLL